MKRSRTWICSQCAARHVSRKKPKRCSVCGSSFKDISEIVTSAACSACGKRSKPACVACLDSKDGKG